MTLRPGLSQENSLKSQRVYYKQRKIIAMETIGCSMVAWRLGEGIQKSLRMASMDKKKYHQQKILLNIGKPTCIAVQRLNKGQTRVHLKLGPHCKKNKPRSLNQTYL